MKTSPCRLCDTTRPGLRRKIVAPRLRGEVCGPCWERLRRALRPVIDGPAPVSRCKLCGTFAGKPKRPGGRPVRISGATVGVNGPLCRACHLRRYKRLARAEKRREAARP